jgi:DNA-binding MarR family transcriptional regulator
MPPERNLISGSHLRIGTATEPDELLAVVAKRIIRLRKKKASMFDQGIFSEPAWDMMLDLFIEESMGRDVPLTSVAIASRVPLTTALRYLKVMENQKLVNRFPHSRDGRVSHVRLTEDALIRMRLILNMGT